MNKTERRICVLEAALADLEKEYDQVFDELIVNDSDTNRSKERRLLQRISEVKKELEKLKGDNEVFSDEEIEAMANGVDSDKQELTEAEEKMFNAMADSF